MAAATPTLSQPFYPGVGSNPQTVDPDALDPHFKPDRTDNFTLTIQRELNPHMNLEVGYIGKILRNEYMLMNLDAVPYMTTVGGQSFAQAYSQMLPAVGLQRRESGQRDGAAVHRKRARRRERGLLPGLLQLHGRAGFQEHHH